MRIGTKKLSYDIYISTQKTKWHTGKFTICIWRIKYNEEYKTWLSNWWKFIPIGKRISLEG